MSAHTASALSARPALAASAPAATGARLSACASIAAAAPLRASVAHRRRVRALTSAAAADAPAGDAAKERYMARGVSASKEDVHAAIADVDKGLFPRRFARLCPIC